MESVCVSRGKFLKVEGTQFSQQTRPGANKIRKDMKIKTRTHMHTSFPVFLSSTRTGSCRFIANLFGYKKPKPTFRINQNDTQLCCKRKCARTYTHSVAQQVRPDCGVARAVIAGQTVDQRGNLNLHDVGGKKATNT